MQSIAACFRRGSVNVSHDPNLISGTVRSQRASLWNCTLLFSHFRLHEAGAISDRDAVDTHPGCQHHSRKQPVFRR